MYGIFDIGVISTEKDLLVNNKEANTPKIAPALNWM